jgi:hypothetical protein
MSKINTMLMHLVALFGLCVFLPISRGEDKPAAGSLAHFRFKGDAKDANKGNPEFELKNTEFKDDALYLNGIYEHNGKNDGYRAVCKTPQLDYNKFTVAIRFKAEEFGEHKSNLFTGGTSHRWFGMNRSAEGNLTITLNNQEFSHEIKDAGLEQGKWTVVACGVDLAARKVMVYLNGKQVATIDLPADFKLRVIESDAKDRDKVWSFTNYSNGTVFHGLVDELIIYGKMLSAEEFAKIPLHP